MFDYLDLQIINNVDICFIIFTGEKAIWRGISKADRDAVKSLIKKELIEKKILELQSNEESDFQITIELYEKYENMCRENKYVGCIVWGDWLEKIRNTNRRQLQLFEESKKEREILSANKSARRHSVVCTYVLIIIVIITATISIIITFTIINTIQI
jgi:hypothetical protein